MMARLRNWPHPLLTGFLVLLWLLLNRFSLGHLVLGTALTLLIVQVTHPFWPETARIRRPGKLVWYVLRLLRDILVANLVVARRILWYARELEPGFVTYRVRLTDELAVTLLASTVTLTPGTVSAHYDRETGTLLIHCLHLDDAQAICQEIRERYEQPLQEIFDA